jgi:GrpB-like predicted nucleotidyltransferase (UPF0157 family)
MANPSYPVVIAEYDPAWPAEYERESVLVRDAIGDVLLDVEHVGSTAVPGLGAKPIIDIMAGIRAFADGERCVAPLEALGYLYKGEADIPGRHYFRKPLDGPADYHIHMVVLGEDFWRRHLLFRDYLRAHPDAARDYYELKLRLAETHRWDRIAYTDAKTGFIEAALAKAVGNA